MKRTSAIFLIFLLSSLSVFAQNAWLNEIHYDNSGTDMDEFVEIALENAGSYTLSDFTVTLYNGYNGLQYDTKSLDLFIQGSTIEGITLFYLVYGENGIQNGEEDGLALSYQGTVVSGQFLSWEGVLTASDGPAAGMTSVDIGVSESSATPVGHSLQLGGTGNHYNEFTWQEALPSTMGQINTNQAFGAFTPDPEPSSYPTDFTANPQGYEIILTWTDATGTQLPAGYLILAGDESISVLPEDGTPIPDDADLSDGSGAMNVDFGIQTYTFGGLSSSTTYFFKIFPFTNAGAYIDYKTDGIPPEADATTSNLTVIHQEDFEDQTLGAWQAVSVSGEQAWEPYIFNDNWFARVSGWSGGSAFENDDWLISPPLNLQNFRNEMLTFLTALNYTGPALQVRISTDYAGSGSPYQAEWEILEATLSPGNFEWTYSGQVDISGFDGEQVYIAFQYTSTSQEAATWEVDDIMVIGEENVGYQDQSAYDVLNAYPNPSSGWFHLDLSPGTYEITIYSNQGREIKKMQEHGHASVLDLSDLPKGFYLLEAFEKDQGKPYQAKILIK